ncbi:MAG TPA: LPS-assembly protein LptD, partial [Anaeromyxobacteraceae bacterium]|nr:LPS-assembly protein LptD [Anaeromyxobacteraceae bacterium]
LRNGTLAELWAMGLVGMGPFSLRGSARGFAFDGRPGGEPAHAFDSFLDRFTELQLDARVGNRRGDFLHAGLISLGPGASGTLMAGVDPLFDLRPAPGEPVAQASAGGQVGVGGATVGYRALFPARERLVGSCRADGTQVVVDPLEVEQHAGTFGWSSPCRCFNLLVAVTVDRCGEVNVGATLDLSALGASLFRPEG